MKQNTENISTFRLSGPLEGPHILLLAGVHGDEYEPMAACNRLYRELEGRLLKGKITFIPHSNPTAYESCSRYGSDGQDMARICPGKAGGSPSEEAAGAVSEIIRTADYLVDMHTGGVMYDIFPLAGYMLHPDPAVLDRQRQMALSYGLPVVWGTDPLPSGRTLSVARDAGVPSIYLEYGGGTGFRKHVVEAYVSGFLNLLRSMEMIPGEYIAPDVENVYRVEDPRPDSGFLQGKMPSPADGIFISEISLGSQVKKGDVWGKILDPETGETTKVLADIDGLAFLMRNIVKVARGDALGGILPITEPGLVTISEDGSVTAEPRRGDTCITPGKRSAARGLTGDVGEARGLPAALITGAAGGIGSATARRLGAAGHALLLADIDAEKLAGLAAELENDNIRVSWVRCDLAEDASWEGLIEATLSKYGRIDVLVNNAAWRVAGSLRSTSFDSWEKTLKVCLTAPVFLAKAAARAMEQQNSGGVIINISSVMAERPSGLAPAYMAAKGALNNLTRELAVTYGRSGIRVVGIAPGYIDTELSNDYVDPDGENISARLISQLTDFIPLGRGGRAEEIADVIAWASSDQASYVTGTTLTVDGGFQPNFNPYSVKKLQYPEEF